MANPSDFAQYVTSVINLDELEKMTNDMDKDIEESQKLMDQIKNLFDSIPNQSKEPTDSGLRHEDISNFLEAGMPKLLLPDMEINSESDVNLDDIVATMKGYAERLKTCTVSSPKTEKMNKDMKELELDEYTASLDQLGKRLANIKLSKREEVRSRSPELEEKLTKLCEDVTMFTQMVQTKTKVTEANKNWSETQQDSSALQYNDMLSKLLSGINEVTYLLQNKN